MALEEYERLKMTRATCSMLWKIREEKPELWAKIQSRAEEVRKREANAG